MGKQSNLFLHLKALSSQQWLMVDVCVNKYTVHVVVVIPGNKEEVSSAADAFFAHVQNKVNGNLICRYFSQKSSKK